jgi:hypothetical protein
MPLAALGLGAALVLVIVATPGAGASRSAACGIPRGAKVVAQDRSGVVYTRREGSAVVYVGCLRRSRRHYSITESNHDVSVVRRLLYAPPYVAVIEADFPKSSGGNVYVRTLAAPCPSRSRQCRTLGFSGPPQGLLLTRRGDVVWSLNGAVGLDDARGVRLLDGARVAPGSLALSTDHRRVYWTRNGAAKSAEIAR